MTDNNDLKHFGIKGQKWGVIRDPGTDGLVSTNDPIVSARERGAAKLIYKEFVESKKNNSNNPERTAALEKGAKVRAENEARMKAESAARLAEAKGSSGSKGKGGGGGKKKKEETDAEKAAKSNAPIDAAKLMNAGGLVSATEMGERIDYMINTIGEQTLDEIEQSTVTHMGRRSLELFIKAMGDVNITTFMSEYLQYRKKHE